MIRSLLSFVLGTFKSKAQLQLEILFLRKQLEIQARTSHKSRLKYFDRLFFNLMTNIFSSWKSALLITKPETVIKWHRQGFRLFWRWKGRHKSGRPKIPQEQIDLIKRIANQNPIWGAPHVHGEMLNISEATVQRYMSKKSRRSTGQRWKTSLKNHSSEIIALDFFTVPTITFRLLYVLVFLSHARRKIILFNLTDHPTSEWATQHLRNAFYDQGIPTFLIRDRDKKFGKTFNRSISDFGIRPILTARRSPWQNGYVERVIGSIRGECLDHLIFVNENQLRTFLKRHIHYYNNQRTHLGLKKDAPVPRRVDAVGEIKAVLVANGVHHYYYRRAA